MSVNVRRDKPNTGRSVFDRSDRGLDEADNSFKSHIDVFYRIYAGFACPPGSFDRRAQPFGITFCLADQAISYCTTDGIYCVRMQDFSHGFFISMFNIRIGVASTFWNSATLMTSLYAPSPRW